jgi:pimeloyl-ACP methyl ester carboxylesterase
MTPTLKTLQSPRELTLSYSQQGEGPALVLVHGSFSDQRTNWEFVWSDLAREFTVYATARRGRGLTDDTLGHSLEDEAQDTVELLEAIGEPVFLVGHSYGAHVALRSALNVPDLVRKLVLYEPPSPNILDGLMEELELLARGRNWEGFATLFFGQALRVPAPELATLKQSEFWAPILMDARASLGDLRALSRYCLNVTDCERLSMPVTLQTGTESKSDLYMTDALAAVLPNSRIQELEGQAHEGMYTNPKQYVDSLLRIFQSEIFEEVAPGRSAAD